MSNTVQVITELQAEIHKVLSPLVPASGKFALLDFPNHSNVGDSAIWMGEIAYFKNWHNMRPSFVSNFGRHSSEQLIKALPEGPIFIHGGGNFGDLWTHHHDFREKIIQEFPNRKIVQLPQSLHFENPDRLNQTARIINAHPDFTLLVRDRNSYAIARQNFTCTIMMCPDMAFAIGHQNPPCKGENPPLFLLRTDKERLHGSVGNVQNMPGPYRLEDWLDEEENYNPKILKQTLPKIPQELRLKMLNRYAVREFFYRRLAEQRVDRGFRQLSSAKFVIADRLHAHIMCVLVDVPHISLDNSYGKLSNFITAWTRDVSNMRQENTLPEAINFYKNFVANKEPSEYFSQKAA